MNQLRVWISALCLLLPMEAGALAPRLVQDSTVSVMVLGSPHLRQRPRQAVPVAVEVVRAAVSRFEPDHVVVEWLHPSIDPASVFNYRARGDLPTLARLWGIDPDSTAVELDRTRAALEDLERRGMPTADIRIRLGKLYYLANDQLNAGYQWWRADEDGGGTGDLARLTRQDFRGHELREFGFEIAREQGLEYLTPFDYQGPEARPEVWGEMLDLLAAHAVATVDGVRTSEEAYEPRRAQFDSLRRAFERTGDTGLEERYGRVPEVAEFIAAWRGFGEEGRRTPEEVDGLTLMRWLQSPEYEASERRIQQQLIPGITIGGRGQARWEGIHRRNELMADFVEADIRRIEARRVLIVVGAGHKFDLEDIFRARGYRIVPSREFVP